MRFVSSTIYKDIYSQRRLVSVKPYIYYNTVEVLWEDLGFYNLRVCLMTQIRKVSKKGLLS